MEIGILLEMKSEAKLPSDPSPEDIAGACEVISNSWDYGTKTSRKQKVPGNLHLACSGPNKRLDWNPPTISIDQWKEAIIEDLLDRKETITWKLEK